MPLPCENHAGCLRKVLSAARPGTTALPLCEYRSDGLSAQRVNSLHRSLRREREQSHGLRVGCLWAMPADPKATNLDWLAFLALVGKLTVMSYFGFIFSV
eukprot:scpid75355/ scgid4323/ 